MDVAGTSLAIISLTLQLLGGCVKCYETFIAVTEMPTQYEHLRIRLTLEQARLLSWGEKVGLTEETLTQPSLALRLHRDTITDILSEIQRLFRDSLKVRNKIESTNTYSPINPAVLKTSPIKSRSKSNLFGKAVRAWNMTTELPIRLEWALVKQDKFADLVAKLISYNDSIISLLDHTTIQSIHDSQILVQLTLLQLTSKVDDLYKLMLATQVSTNSTSDQTVNGKLDSTFLSLVSFKAEQLTVEAGSASNVTSISPDMLQIDGDLGGRSLALYNGGRVWIEWKEYDMISSFSQQMTEERIQKLANLLSIDNTPQQFRVPHCFGYTHNTGRQSTSYGLVYSIPSGMTGARPIALLDLIKEKPKPSLTSRVRLAHAICSSLLYIHSVNWLHKGIRSGNIIFLTPTDQNPNYSSPILSGFEYARPDLPEEQTEKPINDLENELYRHPEALGRPDIRSKKSWDIYSLGIVLIELALWAPITKLFNFGDETRNTRTKIAKVRAKILAESFLSKIGAGAGDRFEEVVKRCINGGESIGIPDGADESDPETAAEMQMAVSEFIVDALRDVHV